jgi:hypothetical protein
MSGALPGRNEAANACLSHDVLPGQTPTPAFQRMVGGKPAPAAEGQGCTSCCFPFVVTTSGRSSQCHP